MNKYIFIFIVCLSSILSFSQNESAIKNAVSENVFFIENKGQWDKHVSFFSREKKQYTWLLGNGNLLLDFFKLTKFENKKQIYNENNKYINDSIKGHRVLLDWIHGSEKLIFTKINKQQAYYNYLIGNNSEKYATEVNLYEEIVGKDLYKGIDIRYYFSNSNLRYDLIVHPHQDANQIKIKLNGLTISLDNDGNVVMHSSLGDIKMQDLYVYEKETKKQISCKWVIGESSELSLLIGAYNKNNTLIIDPLIYSTYLGGTDYDYSRDVAVNSIGEAYITGSTKSADFDTITGAYQQSFNGLWDAFITKFNTSGTAIIYSTFIGGSSAEHSRTISIDQSGNAYITGYTASPDFCVTSGAFQTTPTGVNDTETFVTKLNPSGTSLIFSTLIGGNNDDQSFDLVLDKFNNVYISGWTASSDFDVTLGAYKTVHSGGIYDVYVSKFNSSGSSLLFSTFLGGSSDEAGRAITIDSLLNVYVGGETYSPNFDITPGAFQVNSINLASGNSDAFVTKLNSSGSNIIYSSYLAGTSGEVIIGLVVDSLNNLYAVGGTSSTDFPVSSGCLQPLHGNAGNTQNSFITKFNTSGSNLVFSTFFGGNNTEIAYDIDMDRSGDIYLTGITSSSNFYTTPTAYQPASFIASAFISKFNHNATSVLYSSCFRGSSYQVAYGLALDSQKRIYITGETNSNDFPVTTGAYQATNQGANFDAFLLKLRICSPINFSVSANNITCNGLANGNASVNFGGSSTGFSINWLPIGNSSYSITSLSAGNYTVIVTDTNACSSTQTITITEPAPITASITGLSTICSGYSTVLTANGGSNYLWSNGVNTNTVLVNPSITTNYSVIVSSGLCSDTSNFMVTVLPSPIANITGNDSICNGQSALLSVSGGTTVIWSNGATTSTINVNPLTTTNYSVSVSNGACADTAYTTITVLPIPNANISGNDSICSGQSTVLTASGGSNYNWSSGANTNTVSLNPNNSTNYSVIVSNGNCSDTASFLLKVFPVPVASISGADSICLMQSTILTAGGIGNYTWSNFGTSFNTIIVTPTVNTTYTLIVNNGVCSDTAQKIVIVNPLPNALISGTNSICSGQSTTLIASGGTGYSWSNGGVNPSISISPTSTTNYSVLVTNSFGCQSTAYTTVFVIPIPFVSISGDTVICANDLLILTANGVGNFLWNTGENSSSINTNPSNNTTYVVTASNSCGNDMDSILVIVNPLPNVVVSNDTSILINNTISLFVSGGENYAWLPAGLACNTCSVISVSPNTTTVYTVNVSNNYGCSVSKEIRVIVEDDFEVFIPDIFSPNGDGQNDVLYVRGLGIKDLNFKIYDRWGEKVFESNDISKGWDGTYKGTPLNNAVFVYDLKANLINGATINKHGDVTLVK